MHLLASEIALLEEKAEAVDLAQSPARSYVLSFSDGDLAALAEAWSRDADKLPTLRLASLKKLRHPLSVDFISTASLRKRVPSSSVASAVSTTGATVWSELRTWRGRAAFSWPRCPAMTVRIRVSHRFRPLPTTCWKNSTRASAKAARLTRDWSCAHWRRSWAMLLRPANCSRLARLRACS